MSTESTPVSAPSAPAATAPASTPAPAREHRGGPGGGNNRGPNRGGGGGFRRDDRNRNNRDKEQGDGPTMIEKVVFINRCAKVVKGGRRFSFAALTVVGDQKGNIGVGYGKANEVPDAIKKSTEHAKKKLMHVKLKGDTIPHDVTGEFDGGKVLLKPASPGTGLIAGGGVRAVLEVAGYKDVLSKSMGSNNPQAIVKATLDGLSKLRTLEQIKALRA